MLIGLIERRSRDAHFSYNFDMTFFAVPPLENFVMNRVLGDYMETMLYKVFVSIDEETTLSEVTPFSLKISEQSS